MTVSLRNLCLLCFFIPVITIIISFVWSANLNLISWCIPNFEGCTSISRVGRYEPVKYFFKPLMFRIEDAEITKLNEISQNG